MPSLPVKKSKRNTVASKPNVSTTYSKLTELVSQLPPTAPSNASLNPLADLVAALQSFSLDEPETTSEKQASRQNIHYAIHALKAIFEELTKKGRMFGTPSNGNKRAKIDGAQEEKRKHDTLEKLQAWLKGLWEKYIIILARVIALFWDESVRTSALSVFFGLLQTESTVLTNLKRLKSPYFPKTTYDIFIRELLTTSHPLREDVSRELMKQIESQRDLAYYFLLAALSTIEANTSKSPHALCSNLVDIFSPTFITSLPNTNSDISRSEWFCGTPMSTNVSQASKKRKAPGETLGLEGSTGIFDESEEEESEDGMERLLEEKPKKKLNRLLVLMTHKKALSNLVALMVTLPFDEDQHKTLLLSLHLLLPRLSDPRRIADWVIECLEQKDGVLPVLALNPLFVLMTKYDLEYPNFYTRIYGLLNNDILHVRYRARFFRLLEKFLSSSHISYNLIASFIKRLSRLALFAPPAASIMLMPFIYNLLKLHPKCMTMIHRANAPVDPEDIDPFRPDETDPLKTEAEHSSLWELESLQSHYYSAVSGLAKIFKEVMSKQNYNMEDFLDHNYTTMFETEIQRVMKNAPALAPVPARQPIKDSFFPLPHATDEETEEPIDIVSKLWKF